MSILKVFNSQFTEFITDVQVVFPNDRNIKTAKFYVNKVITVNPSLLIKAWHEYVTTPYSNEINGGNFAFFLEKDYKNDVGTSESYDSEMYSGL